MLKRKNLNKENKKPFTSIKISAKYKNLSQQNIKGAVMQIEKGLTNDCLRFQKYSENFAFQLFIVLQFKR